VELSEPSGQTVEVRFTTRDGEARGGSDFEPASGTLHFSPGELSREVIVKVLHDRRPEPDEGFFLDLESPRHATIDGARARNTIIDAVDAPGGLDERPGTGCTIGERPAAGTGVALVPAFSNLWQTSHIQTAVGMLQAPGDGSRWFVISRPGRVLVFRNQDDVSSSSTALDIRDRINTANEGGHVGMAFHPSFATNGEMFLFYTGPGEPMTTFISRFRSTNGGATFDRDSEVVLIQLDNRHDFHKGGHLAFGPDGFLYIGLGDDGDGNNAQDLNVLPGKVLRLDVDQGSPYAIPADNPLAAGGGRPEIYAWGFRNPWRWNFDRATGDLWLADVGDERWEEIDRVERAGNYGWPYREGAHCARADLCDTPGLIEPLAEWSHEEGGRAAIGGYVYRGKAIPELAGAFVYGDWGWRRIFALVPGQAGYTVRELAQIDLGIAIYSLAEDTDGELYVIAGGRRIFRLAPGTEGAADVLPQRLSNLACVRRDDPSRPAAGFIPYDVNVPFWSDGATKERWVSIPANETIRVGATGDWELPIGSVVLKHFRLNGDLVETRLLVRHADGVWAGYTYEWEDSQEDANLLVSGKTKKIGSRTYTFPSRAQCLDCHTDAAGGTLGLETLQMNRDFTYPTKRTRNQITTFDRLGLFAGSPGDPERLPALPRLTDAAAPVTARARAYLHVNCSHCHRPDSLGRGPADLRFTVPEKAMGICDVAPLDRDPALPNARLVMPGDPRESLLLTRMRSRDRPMPPVGSNSEDEQGVDLITTWIESLAGCP
jgi:uncharacterized repeat protein (TIGR03806 family)